MTPLQIRKIRNGSTRKEFADVLGITENYLYMLETNKRSPSKSLMLLLIKINKEKKLESKESK